MLKQSDGNLPFTIRTDAISYALGAVLLQGEGETEHPIEYIWATACPLAEYGFLSGPKHNLKF